VRAVPREALLARADRQHARQLYAIWAFGGPHVMHVRGRRIRSAPSTGDHALVTVNVALNACDAFRGGKLVVALSSVKRATSWRWNMRSCMRFPA